MKYRSVGFEVHRFAEKESYAKHKGVCLEPDGTMVATNGHILSMYVPTEKDTSTEPRVLIGKDDAKHIRTLSRKLGEAIVDSKNANGFVNVACGDTEKHVEVFDGEYVDYPKVIPQDSDGNISVLLDAKYLKEIAMQVIAMGGDKIMVTFKDDSSPVKMVSSVDAGTVTTVLMPIAKT